MILASSPYRRRLANGEASRQSLMTPLTIVNLNKAGPSDYLIWTIRFLQLSVGAFGFCLICVATMLEAYAIQITYFIFKPR
jgi:hypothetical protein